MWAGDGRELEAKTSYNGKLTTEEGTHMAAAMAMVASAMACASSAPPASPSSVSSSPSYSSSSSSTPSPIPRQVRFLMSIPNTSFSTTSSTSLHDTSLQFANMNMWFIGAYSTQIFLGENEPADSVVKRFRCALTQAMQV
ncbi:hypothetical protein GOP47_0015086 [Adiantum capillus-veneris]|uniref:Uncharacterized protein n=1 Tax=Adiantum capillus-veneris TaxID=13818 RepID=A0A9D4UNY2_ADICA|nr:hypothetical protein GOP47_0015086 [Adiantum capillus-veneris]